ncbi:L-lactate dehydrogenase [compost metagenome]
MGADGVIIARPFVTALYGGEEVGIQTYINKIGQELEETMAMCGAHSIDEITSEMISIPW